LKVHEIDLQASLRKQRQDEYLELRSTAEKFKVDKHSRLQHERAADKNRHHDRAKMLHDRSASAGEEVRQTNAQLREAAPVWDPQHDPADNLGKGHAHRADMAQANVAGSEPARRSRKQFEEERRRLADEALAAKRRRAEGQRHERRHKVSEARRKKQAAQERALLDFADRSRTELVKVGGWVGCGRWVGGGWGGVGWGGVGWWRRRGRGRERERHTPCMFIAIPMSGVYGHRL
jgi:hypothetical protein